MPLFTDLATAAIIKAIEKEPDYVAKLHAVVMLHGGKTLQKNFRESEAFREWRETQRTIGRVEELIWLGERLGRVVDRFIELEERELATEFNKFLGKISSRAKKLAAPIFAKGQEIRTNRGETITAETFK